jgi:hypothetical protein
MSAPWSDDDRRWFEQNPNRHHRVRFSFAGEWPRGEHTVVKQFEPGMRLRLPVLITGPELDIDMMADERLARALFEAALGRRPMNAEEFERFRREH